MNKVAVVTGANGYIGSLLCKELADRGWTVYGVYRNRETSIPLHTNIIPVISDAPYVDISQLDKLGFDRQHGVDVFFHMAWDTVRRKDPISQINCSVGTIGYFIGDRMRPLRVKTFVFGSSFLRFAYDYDDATSDLEATYYGGAKSFATNMMGTYAMTNDSPIFIEAILTNVYGPNSKGRFLDEIIDSAVNNNIIVARTSCKQVYDFVHETDAVDALIHIAERHPKDKATGAYIIKGSKYDFTLKDYLHTVAVEAKMPVDRMILGSTMATDHLFTGYRDWVKDAKSLGWRPSLNFDEGVRNLIKLRRKSWLQRVLTGVKRVFQAVIK